MVADIVMGGGGGGGGPCRSASASGGGGSAASSGGRDFCVVKEYDSGSTLRGRPRCEINTVWIIMDVNTHIATIS